MGDGVVDGISEGEVRVEGEVGKFVRFFSFDVLDDGIEFG